MTYSDLTDKMCDVAGRIHNVNSFYAADIYDAWSRHNIQYSSIAAYLMSAERSENLVSYNVMLYYGDRLLKDGSNREAIWDDGIRIIMTLLDNLPVEVEYTTPVVFNTFEQQFADVLAGVYTQVSIDCPFEQGQCGLPLEA